AAELADLTFTSALNDSTDSSFTYTVNDAGLGVTSAVMNITVNAVNDVPTLADQSFTLAENSPTGFAAGTVAFSDVDADDGHTFSIEGGTGSTAFTIDPLTGEITVADSSALDFELNPATTLIVQITDDGTPALSDSATITINLTDQAEFDVSPIDDADSTANIVNADTTIGAPVGITVIADDADPMDSVTYSLDDDAGGLFAIDSATGVVTLNAALDAQATRSYSIIVRAVSTDGTSSTQTFNIAVQNSSDAPGDNINPDSAIDVDFANEAITPPTPDITIKFDDGSISYSNEDILVTPASNDSDRIERRRSGGGGSSNNGTDDGVSIVVETMDEQLDQVEPELIDEFLVPTEYANGSEQKPISIEINAPVAQQNPTMKAMPVMDSVAINSVMADHALWERLEKMQQEMNETSAEQEERELIVKIVTGSTLTVSAGFVSWILRGGSLLASFLSTLPLWKGFDPLPILATREKKSEEKQKPDTNANADKDQIAVDVLFQANNGQLNHEPGTRT
ncbi:MAG: cadherin domain-containing protein, partial [Pseudomonadales bacterium]